MRSSKVFFIDTIYQELVYMDLDILRLFKIL